MVNFTKSVARPASSCLDKMSSLTRRLNEEGDLVPMAGLFPPGPLTVHRGAWAVAPQGGQKARGEVRGDQIRPG